MNIESATKILRDAVIAWATTKSLTVGYDNLPFSRPEDSTYGMFSVLPGNQPLVGIGGQKRWRSSGIALLRLWTPIERGEEPLHQLIDSFSQTFRSTTLGGSLVTRSTNVNRVGRAGKWWQYNVTLPWYMDTVS